MKPIFVAVLCALSAALGAAAGVYGSAASSRLTADLGGVNAQMNEAATQLKVASALLIQIKQGDAATVRDIVEQSMRAARVTIDKGRANPALTPATLVRVDEAVSLAATAEKP